MTLIILIYRLISINKGISALRMMMPALQLLCQTKCQDLSLAQLLTEHFLRGPDDRDPTADIQSYRFGKDSLQDASWFI
jgi:hypothetical protein